MMLTKAHLVMLTKASLLESSFDSETGEGSKNVDGIANDVTKLVSFSDARKHALSSTAVVTSFTKAVLKYGFG